jgi:glycosyltransferase involved in cell wall biosynthesis
MTLRPTRVLFVDCAPFSGGAQRSLLDMVQGLREEGIDPFVLAADLSPGGVVERCLHRDIPVEPIRIRHWRRSLRGLWQFTMDRRRFLPVLRERLAAWPPDLIHANTVRAALLLSGKVSDQVPLVVHDRDRRAPAIVRHLLAKRAQAILAIGRAVAGNWPATCSNRLHIVPNGLEVAEIARTLPDASCRDHVALVADFVPWKGHSLFLHAFAKVAARRSEARAVLVGRLREDDSRYGAGIRSLVCKLGLGERVTLLDHVACAWPQIASCRLLVSSAKDEPFGRTVVEALALGKPVVAVHGGGPEEILSNCPAGKLVEATPESLAEGILAAWDWQQDHTRSQAARQRAEHYSVRHMCRSIRDIYQGLSPTGGAD